MRERIEENTFRKRVFSLVTSDRESLERAKVGSEVRIPVEDVQGKLIEMSFRVTRNVRLGERAQWIYGEILDVPGDEYHQIEIKLHKSRAISDTVEVFPQAPPSMFKVPC